MRKLEKAKETVKICKLNIEIQEKNLGELNKKIAIIQSKIARINSQSSEELKKLIIIVSKLKVYANLQNEFILEFQGKLTLSKNNLKQLESTLYT